MFAIELFIQNNFRKRFRGQYHKICTAVQVTEHTAVSIGRSKCGRSASSTA